MEFNRRSFLAIGGGAVAAAACRGKDRSPAENPPVAHAKPVPGSEPAATSLAEASWEAIRGEFMLDPAYLNFAGFLLAPHPRAVREDIASTRDALDRNPPLRLFMDARAWDEVRARAADFIGARPEEVALTDSTTMGLGILYGGLKLRPGAEILTTEHDHYSTHASLEYRRQRDGVGLRKVKLFDDGAPVSADELVSKLVAAITPATRVIAVTWVHSATGMKLPVRAMADAIAEVNRSRSEADRAIFCVDGVHGFGVDNVKVADLGCDFFVAGCHKWLFGPRGTGILWGRASHWSNVLPTIPPFEGRSNKAYMAGADADPVVDGISMTPGGFHSFEHRLAVRSAFAFHDEVGRPRIEARIRALNTQLKAGLAAIDKVKLYTPRDPALSAGIVCFDVDGMKPGDVAMSLVGDKIIATTTPYRRSYARLAPGLLNSEAEVDRAIAAVRKLAG